MISLCIIITERIQCSCIRIIKWSYLTTNIVKIVLAVIIVQVNNIGGGNIGGGYIIANY